MNEIERFKEEVLKNYPRLDVNSTFRFECRPGISCFNACCGDVNIFLTPYDIVRLKKRLSITSQEFLDRYSLSPFDKNLKYPVVLLKMNDDERKTCPFVTDEGCTVYEDRPWACRMFPLGMASPSDDAGSDDGQFYFLLQEKICQGLNEKKEWTVGKWLDDQGITEYNRMGEPFKELTLHRFFRSGKEMSPQKMEMFHMVCYNIDKFRDFLFNTSFFDKFEVDENTIKAIKDDDVELLSFGYRWLRFALIGEPTMKVKDHAAQAAKEQLAAKVPTQKQP